MPLVELQLEPGFFSEQSPRGAKGRWADGDHIRFRFGLPEKLKGWIRYEDHLDAPITLAAPIRAAHSWSSLDNQKWLALASAQKLYLINNDVLYDITPIEAEGTLTDPFTTTLSSTVVRVAHVAHGVEVGQNVSFSGATVVGGITINGSYVVRDPAAIGGTLSDDFYYIQHSSAASSAATGGGTVAYVYEIAPPPGTDMYLGYGIGPYGLDNDPNYIGTGYGTARHAINLPYHEPIWSLTHWGEDLMACRYGGPIYTWDRSSGTSTRAQLIPNAPVENNWIEVSPDDRILIAFGSHDGLQRDQALVKWTSQEDYNDWTATPTNTADDKRLDSGSRIITARRTRGETIIFTDRSIYSMVSFGGGFTFQGKGEALALVGPNAVVESSGVLFAMVKDEFVAYDGVIRILPCTVRNHVFGDIDRDSLEKVYAAVNKENSEVWWYYPSDGAADNDSYVTYNYRENTWVYGTMERTAYVDATFRDEPIAADQAGRLWLHEQGYMDGEDQLPAFLQSYDTEIQNIGEYIAHLKKFIPDFLSLVGAVNFTFRTKLYPTAAIVVKGPYPVDEDTRKIDFRARGRQVAVRIADITTTGSAADVLELPAGSSLTLSGGNLTATQGANGAWDATYGDDGRTAGKYVFEIALSAPGATSPYNLFIGIADGNTVNVDAGTPVGVTIKGLNLSAYTPTRITVYADLDAGNGWLEIDGAFVDGNPNVGTDPSFTFSAASTWYPLVAMFNQIAATYRSTEATIESELPDGWLPWAGVTESGVTTPSWRLATLRFDVISDGKR